MHETYLWAKKPAYNLYIWGCCPYPCRRWWQRTLLWRHPWGQGGGHPRKASPPSIPAWVRCVHPAHADGEHLPQGTCPGGVGGGGKHGLRVHQMDMRCLPCTRRRCLASCQGNAAHYKKKNCSTNTSSQTKRVEWWRYLSLEPWWGAGGWSCSWGRSLLSGVLLSATASLSTRPRYWNSGVPGSSKLLESQVLLPQARTRDQFRLDDILAVLSWQINF